MSQIQLGDGAVVFRAEPQPGRKALRGTSSMVQWVPKRGRDGSWREEP